MPYNFENAEGHIEGLSTSVVRKIMAEAGLAYTIRVMPWSRTYREASMDAYGFIYSLARSKDREDKFDWVAPIAKPQFHLFAREADPRIFTFEAITRGDYTIVCVDSDNSCTILRKAGFPEKNLFMGGSGGASEIQMTRYKRVDLFLDDLNHYSYLVKTLGVKDELLRPVLKVGGGVTMYLAAGFHVDKAVRDQVRAAYLRLIEKGLIEIK